MISKSQLFAAAAAGFLICPLAGAQVRNGVSAVVQPSAREGQHAARAAVNTSGNGAAALPSGQRANVIQIPTSRRMAPRFAPLANPVTLDSFSGVPGLGFDFPHLAAISKGLNNNPSHFGHHGDRDGDRGQGFFVPILLGGYPYYYPYYDDLSYDQADQQSVQQMGQQMGQQTDQQTGQPTQPQPQIIVIREPERYPQSTDSGSDARDLSAAAAPPAEVPIPDVGNFIFVRRDGRILFASLFSVVGAELHYVTPEGIRRTLALSDLDTDATAQMNEARGTTVQFHN